MTLCIEINSRRALETILLFMVLMSITPEREGGVMVIRAIWKGT